jgi:L-ascorbate metabolism protein UlaG (beta-lactamase superfamily)
MSPRARQWWFGSVLLLALLGVAAVGVLSLPPFGAKASGTRLERMRANPQYEKGQFVNVERQASYTWDDVRMLLDGQFSGNELREPPAALPVMSVAPASLAAPVKPGLRAFWIGHAGVYVELDGVRLLIDPVFSEYASPFAVGPKRFHPPPIALVDLPRIDAVVISHDHYDHLDMATVRHLAARGTVFFVPLGIGAHLERWQVPAPQIRELEWWQEGSIGGVRFVCTPTRHYSGRGLTDSRATLWSSWSVVGPQHRFFYSGDTGYSKHFAEIGARLGPFDLSFIKVGAYGPGQPWIDIHMSPEDAVRAHGEVGGKRLFPVHWGTFNLAFHAWDEPIRRTVKAAAARGAELVTPRIGQMVDAERPFSADPWWESVR